MSEAAIQSAILRELTRDPKVRLFRCNSGTGWAGQLVSKSPDGTVILRHARPLHAGLTTGCADLIGWYGPRFLSIEVKGPRGRPSIEQLIWRDNVLRAGGIAGIVRSVDEARALLSIP
jgi:hypothetical protein